MHLRETQGQGAGRKKKSESHSPQALWTGKELFFEEAYEDVWRRRGKLSIRQRW